MFSLVPKYRSLLIGAAAAAGAAISGVALAALGLGLLLRVPAPRAAPSTVATVTSHPVAKIQPLELRPIQPEPAKPTAPKAQFARPQRRVASPTPASSPCEGGWRELVTGPAGRRVYVDCPGGPLTQASRTSEPASTGLSRLAVPGTDHVPVVKLGVSETFAHGTNEAEP
jgi:hypothetical protein